VGCGGFIDITQSAKRVVFCSPLTTGGLKVSHERGLLHILEEGKIPKLVPTLRQITFSGQQSLARGQKVLLVTERCVFRLHPDGWEIIEVAAGIDPVRQVQELAGFPVRIASDLKIRPAG
jgi:propionate CoA-transferase